MYRVIRLRKIKLHNNNKFNGTVRLKSNCKCNFHRIDSKNLCLCFVNLIHSIPYISCTHIYTSPVVQQQHNNPLHTLGIHDRAKTKSEINMVSVVYIQKIVCTWHQPTFYFACLKWAAQHISIYINQRFNLLLTFAGRQSNKYSLLTLPFSHGYFAVSKRWMCMHNWLAISVILCITLTYHHIHIIMCAIASLWFPMLLTTIMTGKI